MPHPRCGYKTSGREKRNQKKSNPLKETRHIAPLYVTFPYLRFSEIRDDHTCRRTWILRAAGSPRSVSTASRRAHVEAHRRVVHEAHLSTKWHVRMSPGHQGAGSSTSRDGR